MNLKTKFAILAMSALLIFNFSSCNEKQQDNNDGTAQDAISSSQAESTENTDIASDSQIENENPKDLSSVNSLEELEEIISTDFEDTISALSTDFESLQTEIDTYDKYLENTDKIEAFYNTIKEKSSLLCNNMYEYALKYAEIIMASDKSNDDKYDDFDDLRDCIYEDAADEINDEIYNGILDDMHDTFYNGILDDAHDNAPYDEWYDARSDEYDWWYDTRSDVYDNRYDARSDIYDFCSDMRSELWNDDVDKANEKLQDFKSDVEKMKNN